MNDIPPVANPLTADFTDEEIRARADAVVKRMLNTPPKPLPKPQEGRRPGRPIAS